MIGIQASQIREDMMILIANYCALKVENIYSEMKLRDDLGLDSFGAVELIYETEMKFKIGITNTDLKNIITVSDIIDLVINRIESKQ